MATSSDDGGSEIPGGNPGHHVGVKFKDGFLYDVYIRQEDGPLGIVLDGFPPHPVRVDSVDFYRAPAGVKDVRPGDTLVAIDAVDVQSYPAGELAYLLQQRPLLLQLLRQTKGPPADTALPNPQVPELPPYLQLTPDSRGVVVSASERASTVMREDMVKKQDGPLFYEVRAYVGEKLLGIIPGSWPPDPVVIESVLPDSVAIQQGVLAGDVVQSVNGEQVVGMKRSQLVTALRKRPLVLVLERPGHGKSAVVGSGSAGTT